MIDPALCVTKLNERNTLSYDFLQYKEDKEKLFNPKKISKNNFYYLLFIQQEPFFRFMDDKIQIHTDS